jgi:hypothetical protein
VYRYERGTWYPFAPSDPDRRDTSVELQVRSVIADNLWIEQDLGRWFPSTARRVCSRLSL